LKECLGRKQTVRGEALSKDRREGLGVQKMTPGGVGGRGRDGGGGGGLLERRKILSKITRMKIRGEGSSTIPNNDVFNKNTKETGSVGMKGCGEEQPKGKTPRKDQKTKHRQSRFRPRGGVLWKRREK